MQPQPSATMKLAFFQAFLHFFQPQNACPPKTLHAAMEQALVPTVTEEQGGEPNPADTTSLCLVSLDGGGVRRWSTLYILKDLMAQLNQARQAASIPSVN